MNSDKKLDGEIQDLVDFYLRWPEFRAVATNLQSRPELTDLERETIHWLAVLADKVGDRDLPLENLER